MASIRTILGYLFGMVPPKFNQHGFSVAHPRHLQEPTRPNDDCRSFFKTTHCEADLSAVKVVSYNLYWWNAFGLKENGALGVSCLVFLSYVFKQPRG